MRTFDLTKTVSVLANVGVVIGILLLVFELNQNRQLMEAQTRSTLAQGLADNLFLLSTDESTSDLYFRAQQGEVLTDAERSRYFRLMLAQFGYIENVHYQYRIGLYDETEFFAQRSRWKSGLFSSLPAVQVWCTVHAGFSPEFVEEIRRLLEDPCE